MKKNDVDISLKLATRLIYRVMYEGAYSSVIPYSLKEKNMDFKQKNYISILAFGVIENFIYLEHILSKFTRGSIKKNLKILIMAALFEIEFMENNASHITVNRYVNYAKAEFPHASGFVNGVLRNHLRRKADAADLDTEILEDAAVYYSHPLEIAKLWEKAYGREEALAIMRENCKKLPLSLRYNTALTNRDELIESLGEEGVSALPSAHSELAVEIGSLGAASISDLNAYKKGLFYVQDISSIKFSEDLAENIKSDSSVLDMCAAPGGKTLLIAEKIKGGVVISCDISETKLGVIEDNARRMKLKFGGRLKAADFDASDVSAFPNKLKSGGIFTLQNDASKLVSEFKKKFDLVICDVPCSGLGVIRKKPEIKYRKEVQNLRNMLELQSAILNNGAEYLAKDGILAYSTCTMNPEENELMLAEFLKSERGSRFELIKEVQMSSANGYSDGFYYSIMQKKDDF